MRQIIEDHQHVARLGREIFGHCQGGIGGDVRHARRPVIARRHDDGVRGHAAVTDSAYNLGHGIATLTDCTIDTDDTCMFLVQDRIDRQRGFAGLPVADNQLTLPQPDRHRRVDHLDPGGQRARYGLSIKDFRGLGLDRSDGLRRNRAFVIQRLPKGTDDAAQKGGADLCADNLVRPHHAFADGHAV